MDKFCGKEKCEHWERDDNNNCKMMMDISLCNRSPFLIAKTPGGATLACCDGLDAREIELMEGMIEVHLSHATRCEYVRNRKMAEKQKGWDLERVALLEKLLKRCR